MKARVLERVSGVEDEEWRAFLILGIEMTLKLEETEERAFRRLLSQTRGYEEVNAMLTVYEARGIEKGLQKGKGETLIRLLRMKFGEMPDESAERIMRTGPEELDACLDRVLSASSLEEMGLANGAP